MIWRSRYVIRLAVMVFAFAFSLNFETLAASGASRPAKPAPKLKSASKVKKKVDFNALGTAAFQKRNFPEALKHYSMATNAEPKNPVAWLNRARATVAVNIANEPVDYCDESKNWILDVLSYLSMAIDLNRSKTISKIATFTDSNFSKFRVRPEFKNWFLLTKLPLKTDVATEDFFVKNNDWLIRKQPMPSTVVTFGPDHVLTMTSADGERVVGTWSAGADRVVTKLKSELRTLKLAAGSYRYHQGQSIRRVVLKDREKGEEWILGPEIADCSN